jgi:8-oxo-dGTP diphosphatase
VKHISVVAAVVQRSGRLLICQRRRDDVFPLKWEFPGGKIKAGESPQQALARELEEELGVKATVGPEIYRTRHHYTQPETDVELIFFSADVGEAEPHNLAFEQIVWAERKELEKFDFLQADRDFIRLLATGKLELPAR